jgi:dolichol-phosphate mannosyltransferase
MDYTTVGADGYGFQVEMTHRLVRSGGRIVEFPITFRDRAAGESKLSNGIVREALVLVVRLWIEDRRGRRQRRRIGG